MLGKSGGWDAQNLLKKDRGGDAHEFLEEYTLGRRVSGHVIGRGRNYIRTGSQQESSLSLIP